MPYLCGLWRFANAYRNIYSIGGDWQEGKDLEQAFGKLISDRERK